MKKEIHVWLHLPEVNFPFEMEEMGIYFDIKTTYEALKDDNGDDDNDIIQTTQPHFCNTSYLVKGYRLFVHLLESKMIELKLGWNEELQYEIRANHNLEKMLMSNVFGLATPGFEGIVEQKKEE